MKKKEETNTKSSKKVIMEKLLAFHNEQIEKSKTILMNDEVNSCFVNIVNTSGGVLVLPDFHALSIQPNSELTFKMEAGERLNLLTMFDVKDINRNRQGLIIASKMKGVYGFPALTFIERMDVVFPFELRKETMYEKGVKEKEKFGEGTKIPLPKNEFDVMLEKEIAKEKKANEKISNMSNMSAGSERKTKEELELEEIEKL